MMARTFALFTVFIFNFCNPPGETVNPDKVVVLTFDDAVKSHATFVAPLLQELDFGATFFISYRWMQDTVNFMSWDQVGDLHNMGFEIGNHSWSHVDFSLPENIARLEGELGLIDLPLTWQGVPKPVSFAYCGNWFAPETVVKLQQLGYKYARRGMQPEIPYGEMSPGPLYDPTQHHPLLIPSAGDAYPGWTLEHFKKIVNRVEDGKIAVLQFHGVPDRAHQWVTTDPQLFRKCMQHLKEHNFKVIALRDLEEFIPEELPSDPFLEYSHSSSQENSDHLPQEMAATRENMGFWLQNMLGAHRYRPEEIQQVTGYSAEIVKSLLDTLEISETAQSESLVLMPYPGGRHPRIGFLDGAFDPMRGTKFSVFHPNDPSQYLVIDLPEAIFSNLGLTFLAHRHIPTLWDYQFTFIDNVDWKVNADGSLENSWTLPNGITFGALAQPGQEEVNMNLWLYNGTDERLDSLKTQVCVMLKGADQYRELSNDNKLFSENTAAVKSSNTDEWILTSWEHTFNPWGNPDVPCIHTDPMFEACQPGDTVRLAGKLWFHRGKSVEQLMDYE